MRYLSLFSGIEAASVAWHPLGWEPVAFAEVEPFPSAVLAERFPNVPNLGDVTKFKEWNIDGPINLIVGGSPCQAFSVAGFRKGLDDPRGDLSLTYLAIVAKYLPEWIVWENVPGVLSSSGGRDFGSFLGALDEIGYGYAWRVLDAQYVRTPDYPRAVPQRRRRVFLVGNLRSWQRSAAVLFDSESLSGNPPPIRTKRENSAADFGGGVESNRRLVFASEVSSVDAKNKIDRGDSQHAERLIVENCWWDGGQTAASLTTRCHDQFMPDKGNFGAVLTHTLNDVAGTFDASYYKGQGERNGVEREFIGVSTQSDSHCFPLNTMAMQGRPSDKNKMTMGIGKDGDPSPTLSKAHSHAVAVGKQNSLQVRRLTPLEAERLQGFPDNWTRIAWRGKCPEDCPNSPRYTAIGNSMAVNVMQWIGLRIAMFEELNKDALFPQYR